MSVLDIFRPPAHVAAFAAMPLPEPMAVASAAAVPGGRLLPTLRGSLDQINESVGMSIPAVRRAVHVIAGTISTFALAAWWDGNRLPATELNAHALTWLPKPDPAKTLSTTLAGTVQDGIWRDRSYWYALDRYFDGRPAKLRRIQPDRVSMVPDMYDPDIPLSVQMLGVPSGDDGNVPLDRVVMINWAGIGGLRRWGFEMLDLYMQLQTAAARYAAAPHPKAILRNHGADLAEDEIEALLAAWEAARDTRSVGYLNDVVEYETFGWNASEMQLTEAREYAALEVARLFGLPAWALDASGGDSMTYSNVTDRRMDLVEALRPWMTPIEQTLSATQPAGTEITFDVSAYTRDSPEARMRTWQTARAANVLSIEEIRRVEPLADLAAGAPDQPAAAGAGPTPLPAPAPAPDGSVPNA